jgi:hypothetical protein
VSFSSKTQAIKLTASTLFWLTPGNGRAGWGYGKGPTLSDAVLAAQKDCERNSFFIDRYKGQCITYYFARARALSSLLFSSRMLTSHKFSLRKAHFNCVCLFPASESIRFSYKKCSVDLFALPEGRMHPTSSQVMQLVFNAFGLQYIAGKWRGTLISRLLSFACLLARSLALDRISFLPMLTNILIDIKHCGWRAGSTNKTKRIKTLFMALQQAEHPDFLSEKLGMKLFKPRKVPRKHGRVWAYD